MNTSSRLSVLVMAILIIVLSGCEIFRTEEDAQGEIREFTPPEAAQVGVIVRLQPLAQQINVNETTTVDIFVDNVTDLFGAEIQVQFAPSILQVQDADPNRDGVQISPGTLLSPDFIVTNAVDNTAGLISYILTQVDPVPPANGSGLLASFTVRAIAPGNSPFIFATVKLANVNGQPIPATVQESQITVGPGQAPTPTTLPGVETATPTATSPVLTMTLTPIAPTATVTPTVVITPTAPPPVDTPIPTPIATLPPPPPTATSTPGPLAKLPEGATIGFCYRVQKGDTLQGIAQNNQTTVQNIEIANDLYPPGHIYIQKALFIPTHMGSGPNFYIWQAGDTLGDVASRCNLPLDFVIWVNKPRFKENNSAVKAIQPGELLEIPIPPFPPPARYPYPQSGPYGPPSVYPPPSAGPPGGRPCGPGCSKW